MTPLSTEQLRKHLNRITYKPGWGFHLRDGRWEGQHFIITATVPNAYRQGETTSLDIHTPLPPQHSHGAFEAWLAWRLARIEIHEMREFLHRDGRPIYNPHAPYSERDEQ